MRANRKLSRGKRAMKLDEIVSQVRGGGIVDRVRKKIAHDSPKMQFGLQLYVGQGVSDPLDQSLGEIHRQLSRHIRGARGR